MSEVIKRDKTVRQLASLCATIKRDQGKATLDVIAVWDKQIAEIWSQFNDRHDAVLVRAGSEEMGEQNTLFDDAHSSYYNACLLIEKQRVVLLPETTKAAKGNDVNVLRQFQSQHSFSSKRLLALCARIEENGAQMDVSEKVFERQNMETAYSALQALGLQRIAAGDNEEDVLEDEAEVDVAFRNALKLLFVEKEPIVECVANGLNSLKLPTLQITPFDGQFDKWEAFRESFLHGVHERANMAGVQKLQCLKGLLRGEPEELIQNFGLTNDNYATAWTLLNQRYNNTFELVTSHIRGLMTMPVCNNSSDDLRRVCNKTTSSLMALRNLGRAVDGWDDWVVFVVCEKLDKETRRMWLQQVATNGDNLPTWDQLDTFMQGRIRALVSDGPRSTNPIQRQLPRNFKIRANHATTRTLQSTSSSESVDLPQFCCGFCGRQHLIIFCDKFRNLSPEDRRKAASDKALCFICLLPGHHAMTCTSNRSCSQCNRKHNSLLHASENQQVDVRTSTSTYPISKQRPPVILATAVVNVCDVGGEWHQMRALLDQGADWSIVSERSANILQLPRNDEHVYIGGVGGINAGRCSQSITMTIGDHYGVGPTFEVCALILPKLSGRVKSVRNTGQVWPHLQGLRLADPEFDQRHSFDIIIGSEVYGTLLRPGLRQSPGLPTGQNSVLGWLISGAIYGSTNNLLPSQMSFTHHVNIDDQLARFWEIEESTNIIRNLTVEEEKCETFFDETVTRDETGRLHVRIPMKNIDVKFGESQRYAVQRQLPIERRFKSNTEFAQQYRDFMNQYISLGHMEEVVGAHVDMTRTYQMCGNFGREYYIPHHAVIKEASTTTKLRVVFDASRKTTNGVSLNEQMRIGPRLHDDLNAIMMRWRQFRIGMSADIEKMYRQIVVDNPDNDLQRIVWRESAEEKMKVFRLCTVTYGTASAPYLAVKSLQTLAKFEREQHPRGAQIIFENCYVDDILCGADSIHECQETRRDVVMLMAKGGFTLHKWASNSDEVMQEIEPAIRECDVPLRISDEANVSTLGFYWNPGGDHISVKINIPIEGDTWTKRTFLSAASKMYDPLGWLAPTIISVKILFQSLWKHDLDWDDTLPVELSQKWNILRSSLHQLREIRIPRWIGTTKKSEIEIHGFCDASMMAYAAVVFVRVTSPNQQPEIYNVCAKTKVAPIKVISLPRLELCGAVLLVKSIVDVKNAMKWTNIPITCWTDSTIVLSWLRGHPSRFNVFVANRSSEIQRNFPIEHWRHVATADNPADCASRGITPEQLLHHNLWWTGPQWLVNPPHLWPNQPILTETSEETRVTVTIVNVSEPWDLITKFSSWRKLTRVTAWVFRFVNNSRKHKQNRHCQGLMSSEILDARDFWVKHYQVLAFHDDIKNLKANQIVGKGSQLRSLNPFMSTDNILRVGGRLINADLPPNARTPAIIPRRSLLSGLLIRNAHEETLHGGPALMLAFLRRAYWIIDGPNEVRRFVNRCVICFRYTAKPEHQQMAPLPSPRVTPSRPFSHCAMDYSGAIFVRTTKGRGHRATKAYVAVFVCLATKAVHIELVGDLTTTGFIAAYERFVSRRGCCSDLYSDNATNYVGAATVFLRTERQLFNEEVHSALANKGTNWHFSPPLSPHFNGLAESAIRCVKFHIRRVVGELTLTFEELVTVLTKIEACLNSRPVCSMSNDINSFDALTPAHFLIGEPLTIIPQRDVLQTPVSALTRWQLTHQLVQRFWKRWSKDYLHTLQQRRKWQSTTDNVKTGELVLIIEDNMPPAKWALGRIVEVHPGDDGKVRVVTIKTKSSTLKRSVVKVARLPID